MQASRFAITKGFFWSVMKKSSFHVNAICTIFPYFLIHGRQLSIERQVKGKKQFFFSFLVYCLRGRILIFPEIFIHLISALKTPDFTFCCWTQKHTLILDSQPGVHKSLSGCYPNFYSYIKIFPKRSYIFEMECECEYCVYKSLVYYLRDTLSLKG